MVVCFITEVVMTMMFLFIIMGATHGKAPAGFAPLAIGLALVMIHLVSIPVTNTSVNPARSTGPALFAGGWALAQLWLLWVAPLIGGALGGAIYRWPSGPAVPGNDEQPGREHADIVERVGDLPGDGTRVGRQGLRNRGRHARKFQDMIAVFVFGDVVAFDFAVRRARGDYRDLALEG